MKLVITLNPKKRVKKVNSTTLYRCEKYPLNDVEIVGEDAKVDWLTITCSDKEMRKSLLERFTRAKCALTMLGEYTREWGMHGYKGLQCGGLRWGTRKDSDIAILIGQDAYSFWRVFLPLATNVSRVDLAVTVETKQEHFGLLELYADWMYHNSSASLKRCVRLDPWPNSCGTLYVNKRASDQMGRVYDKAAHLGLQDYAGRLWRYEVEYKHERAGKVAHALKEAGTQFVDSIYCTVHDWFNVRDIPPIFDKRHRDGWTVSADVAATVTSTSASLNWLSSQVRPTVARLRASGLEDQVLEALGLD